MDILIQALHFRQVLSSRPRWLIEKTSLCPWRLRVFSPPEQWCVFLSHQFSLPIEDNNLPSCEVRFAKRTITLILVYTRANTSASKCWQNIFPISSLQSEAQVNHHSLARCTRNKRMPSFCPRKMMSLSVDWVRQKLLVYKPLCLEE